MQSYCHSVQGFDDGELVLEFLLSVPSVGKGSHLDPSMNCLSDDLKTISRLFELQVG